jgi:hypothetical protein
MFSIARTTAKTPRDFEGAFDVVKGCLRIIWQCRTQGTLKWWALENPTGYLRQWLGVPQMTFNPYDFGDPWTKSTDLWGYYRKPEFNYCRPEFNLDQAEVKLRAIAKSLTDTAGFKSSDFLAVTPPGFTNAFYKANK